LAFFFFGTLMDREVLEHVLDRPLAGGELAPARLAGFRRVRSARGTYPLLVPRHGGIVEGVLLKAPGPRDARRITHFEDGEYESRWLAVRSENGAPLRARVFLPLPPSHEPTSHGISSPGRWRTRRPSSSSAGTGCEDALPRRDLGRTAPAAGG
jgi:hypothetical protein